MSDFVDYSFALPTLGPAKSLTRQEKCETAIPFECTKLGSVLTFWDWRPSTAQKCAVAEDLYKGCIAGAWNPNLVPGSGAGKAPPLAAQPGVNYNDPKVLQAIAEEQKKNDMSAWLASIAANMRLMSGDGSKPDDPKEPGLNFMILAALAIVIGGALLAKR